MVDMKLPAARDILAAYAARPDPPPIHISIRASAITTPRANTKSTQALPVAAAIEPLDRPGLAGG